MANKTAPVDTLLTYFVQMLPGNPVDTFEVKCHRVDKNEGLINFWVDNYETEEKELVLALQASLVFMVRHMPSDVTSGSTIPKMLEMPRVGKRVLVDLLNEAVGLLQQHHSTSFSNLPAGSQCPICGKAGRFPDTIFERVRQVVATGKGPSKERTASLAVFCGRCGHAKGFHIDGVGYCCDDNCVCLNFKLDKV